MLVDLEINNLSFSSETTPFLFLDNICLHEMWHNGPSVSSFSLSLAALLIHFEMEGSKNADKLLYTIHKKWEKIFRSMYPEIKTIRSRLLIDATKLTSSSGAIAKFEKLRMVTFEDLLHRALQFAALNSALAEEKLGKSYPPGMLIPRG